MDTVGARTCGIPVMTHHMAVRSSSRWKPSQIDAAVAGAFGPHKELRSTWGLRGEFEQLV